VNIVQQTSQYCVIDDVLDAGALTAIRLMMSVEKLTPVNEHEWENVWRLSDGHPLLGRGFASQSAAAGTAMEEVIGRVVGIASGLEGMLGKAGQAWTNATGKLMIYPAGTGLSWHNDAGGRAGAYTLYIHREWNVQWGGELVIADPSCKARLRNYIIGAHLENPAENKAISEVGICTSIIPKPNRLVILAAGHMHKIATVANAAGDRMRCAVSGFFTRPLSKTGDRRETAAVGTA
jgi:hypothetical protein